MNRQDSSLHAPSQGVTVAQVEILHLRKDDSARRILADFIQHRLIDRYVTPLENVPTDYRSGFLMMAVASLMIETFQYFKEGKKDTKQRGMGDCVCKFLQRVQS